MQLSQDIEKSTRMRRLNVVSLKMVRERTLPYHSNVIRSPRDIYNLAKEMQLPDEDREHCVILALSTKNHVTAIHTLSIGNLNSSIVHPREVFKVCILANAASFVIMHNHPSNDPTFSPEDVQLTQRLMKAAEIIGIECLDHVVVTHDAYLSMKEQDLMN